MPCSKAPMSRRQMLRSTAMAAGGAALVTAALNAPAARAQTKVSQADAGYQATPKNGQSCASCALFQPPSSCSAVDGTISAAGWCKLYQKKS